MTMSDIDMKLIGLYKFEIYYNEQDGEIEHGHNPYTFVILADSMDRLAYGIAQREREWSMVGRRMYFDIATFIHVKAPDGIRLYDYDDFEISIIGGADFTDMHYAVYLTDEENPMNVSDDPDTYTKLVDAVSALYKPDDHVQLFIDSILAETLYNSGAVQGEIKFWKKHDDDTEKVERVYADEYLKHLYLRDWSRIEVKKDP